MSLFLPDHVGTGERELRARRPLCAPDKVRREIPVERVARGGVLDQTLDDLMVGAWVGLRAGAPIACPLCDAVMEPRWSAGSGVVGGRCGDCGCELA